MAPSNFVPTIGEGVQTYASTCPSHVTDAAWRTMWMFRLCCTPWKLIVYRTCFTVTGIWQDRDESGNPSQKHDVELVKDDKRWAGICRLKFESPFCHV